jgi:hypothetical protein
MAVLIDTFVIIQSPLPKFFLSAGTSCQVFEQASPPSAPSQESVSLR